MWTSSDWFFDAVRVWQAVQRLSIGATRHWRMSRSEPRISLQTFYIRV